MGSELSAVISCADGIFRDTTPATRDGGRKKSCTGISRFARVPHIVIQPLPPHTLILVACQCVGPWCRISVSHTPDTFGRDQQSNIKCWGCGGYGFHATSLVQDSFRQPYAHPRANSHARCPATLQAAVMGVVVVAWLWWYAS